MLGRMCNTLYYVYTIVRECEVPTIPTIMHNIKTPKTGIRIFISHQRIFSPRESN